MENLDKVYAKRIAEEYAPKTTTKVVQLKKLDQKVKRPANIFAFTFGTISALIAGTGMSMIMTDFGLSGTTGLVLGIILGVVGFIGCGVNYLAYLKILKSRKEKYAFEITELAKEISEELKKQHEIDIDKKKIILKETIKLIGRFVVEIKFGDGIMAKLKLNIIAE